MDKKTLVSVVVATVLIVGAGWFWWSTHKTQQDIASYQDYNASTANQLEALRGSVVDSWKKKDKTLADYEQLVDLTNQQIALVKQRKAGLPNVNSSPLVASDAIDRQADEKTLQEILELTQELNGRMKVEAQSKTINQAYDDSDQTIEDYTKAMRALSELAGEQSRADYANSTDQTIAKQYSIIVEQLNRTEQAEDRRDRPAYDAANRKIDAADVMIRSIADDIDNHTDQLLARLNESINDL